jgi:hypothetical protein
MTTRGALRDAMAREVAAMRAEFREEMCEMRALLLHRLPAPAPVEDGDAIGVVDAAELALRSPATLRRLIDSGAPIGRFDHATGRYVCSKRGLRDYFIGRFGKAPPGLA